MLSKNLTKYVQSLQQKKYRQQHGAFLVEGAKSVLEVLASDFQVDLLLATDAFLREQTAPWPTTFRTEPATPDELARVGTLESNKAALAVVRTKENRPLVAEPGEMVLVLDDVRDPGNLGTILRIADWYGVRKLICSDTTADVYNPKVISASKGSFTRVQWYYANVVDFLASQPNVVAYGAFLDGESVHATRFRTERGAYVVMGNESNGISDAVAHYVTDRITIPRYGHAESLNVGIATAVLLDNWRRLT